MAKRGSSVFPGDEGRRGRLANGKLFIPQPHFSQPDNGVQSNRGGKAQGMDFDPTKARVKSTNEETDISGGMF